MRTDRCAVCNAPALKVSANDSFRYDCVRCGVYKITGTGQAMLASVPRLPRAVANISGFLKENREFEIDSKNPQMLLALPTPTVSERAEKLLFALRRQNPTAGHGVEISLSAITELLAAISRFAEADYAKASTILNNQWLNLLPLVSECWAEDGVEFNFLLAGYLTVSKKYLFSSSGFMYVITADGWEYLESNRPNTESNYAFVAMSFDSRLYKVFQLGMEPGIEGAGYKPIRIDRVEHVNRIDDEIIAMVRKSRFVVADLTEQKNGVYFEAGFAQGLGLPVIWSCKRSDLENVHFDARQYNLLLWEDDKLAEFSERLRNRIESVVGKGTYKR